MEEYRYLAERLSLPVESVKGALRLLDEGATVPFIARYRREVTGDLSDETLRKLVSEKDAYRALEERRKTVLDSLAKQGIDDPAVLDAVKSAATMSALEDVYRPYKPRRETRGSRAREAGLEPLLDFIFHDRTGSLKETAAGYISEAYPSPEDCVSGALDIWAERISDSAADRKIVRSILERYGKIVVSAAKDAPERTYESYVGQSIPLASIRSHQVLALTRGEREKCLKLSFEFPEESCMESIASREKPAGFRYSNLLTRTVEDACRRLLFPSVENEVWKDLVNRSKEESTEIFARGVKEVLMAPPLTPEPVLGYDPGFAHGCKLAAVDATGKVIDTGVIYPFGGERGKESAKRTVVSMVRRCSIACVALGNGTASRESADFLEEAFSETGIDIPVYTVSESGASVYSVTPLAAEEFPDYDVNLRSAVSIARRLQDPLAELVKVPPESLGVGQYQHDLDPGKLSGRLSDVVEDCVSSVGVDVNTASAELLSHVSGLNRRSARSIVETRDREGRFASREQLKDVSGFGPKAYANAVGFLRIDGKEPLDNTFIHPESYPVARRAIEELGIGSREDAASKLRELGEDGIAQAAQRIGTDRYTLQQVLEELAVPHRDPRGSFAAPHFDRNVRTIEDLKPGMVVEGTVRNVVAFGAYVDIGVHKDGLIHISEMSDRRISDPSQVVSIGQVVRVLVTDVDVERKRISLSLKRLKEAKRDGSADRR